jgi:ribonuclease T1
MDAAAGGALRAMFDTALHAFVAMVFGLSMALFASGADARSSLGTIRAADLPEQGRQVLAAIHAGGPFAFKRDGIVFGNREGVLPKRPRGYYAEYTVPTPGERTRGARRIIAGKGTTGDFRTSDEYYYTNDHYESFRRIVP